MLKCHSKVRFSYLVSLSFRASVRYLSGEVLALSGFHSELIVVPRSKSPVVRLSTRVVSTSSALVPVVVWSITTFCR